MEARPIPPAPVRFERDASGFITAIDGDVSGLLGWTPDDLLGRPSTEFIHPLDQPSAINAWMSMIKDQDLRPSRWRGRYRNAGGDWVWVETVNTNRLADPEHGCILTLMNLVEGGELSIEEQLRAREQLLSQLADALPIGLVQFDAAQAISFTNDRVHSITAQPEARTLEELLGDIDHDDQPAFHQAVAAVADGHAVDGLEIRIAGASRDSTVCLLNLRALSDADGTITGAIATVQDVTEQARLRRSLEVRAATDELTSCLNRRAILAFLEDTIRAGDTGQGGTAVVFLDLDGFKRINDEYGHTFGDDVLAAVAASLSTSVRAIDHVGRLGGDEFLIVCPAVEDIARAHQIAERVNEGLRSDLHLSGHAIAVRASIGVAFTMEPIDPDVLVARADHEMYEAKRRRTAHPA